MVGLELKNPSLSGAKNSKKERVGKVKILI